MSTHYRLNDAEREVEAAKNILTGRFINLGANYNGDADVGPNRLTQYDGQRLYQALHSLTDSVTALADVVRSLVEAKK